MARPRNNPSRVVREDYTSVSGTLLKPLAKDFALLCLEENTTRSRALGNFVRQAVAQKELVALVSPSEGEKFNHVTKSLGLTHSEAMRQLIQRVNSGSITLHKSSNRLTYKR